MAPRACFVMALNIPVLLMDGTLPMPVPSKVFFFSCIFDALAPPCAGGAQQVVAAAS